MQGWHLQEQYPFCCVHGPSFGPQTVSSLLQLAAGRDWYAAPTTHIRKKVSAQHCCRQCPALIMPHLLFVLCNHTQRVHMDGAQTLDARTDKNEHYIMRTLLVAVLAAEAFASHAEQMQTRTQS